jgi:hypothetical protein
MFLPFLGTTNAAWRAINDRPYSLYMLIALYSGQNLHWNKPQSSLARVGAIIDRPPA